MTHKEECIYYCIDLLQSRSLLHVFNKQLFEHYYRKNDGYNGNAYLVGMHASDLMINNYEPKQMEVNNDDRSNETETGNTERA